MRQRLRLKNKHRSWTVLRQSQGWTRKSWLYVLLQTKGLINLGISLINFFSHLLEWGWNFYVMRQGLALELRQPWAVNLPAWAWVQWDHSSVNEKEKEQTENAVSETPENSPIRETNQEILVKRLATEPVMDMKWFPYWSSCGCSGACIFYWPCHINICG